MAERIVKEESLISVADAIRAKGGTSGALSFPDGFKTAIEAIQTGGEQDTPVIEVSNGGLITATAGDKSATKQLSTQSGKTITPGPTEQIAVAAGKYVTGDVIVAAVQGGGGSGDGSPYVVTVTANISASVSVTAEDYVPPKTHALYNGVRLPTLPSADASQYEYFWIRKDTKNGYYDLLCGNLQPWYSPSDPGIRYGTSTGFVKWYQIAISTAETATAWTIKASTSTWFGVDDNRPVLWSNHDILHGSATSTTIYFEGTDPVPTD